MIQLSKQRLGWVIAFALVAWVGIPVVCWLIWGIDDLEDWLTKNVLPVGLLWSFLWLATLVYLWKGSTS